MENEKNDHEKTSMSVCLVDFWQYENGKINKFCFSRFNQSTHKWHMNIEMFHRMDDP